VTPAALPCRSNARRETLDSSSLSLSPAERGAYEAAVAAARAALGADAFAAAWAEGRALPLEQAVAEALTTTA
jgi:hypothetical protein